MAVQHLGDCCRYVPVPKVAKEDRLLFTPLPIPGPVQMRRKIRVMPLLPPL